MASGELVDIIRQGTKAWNQWRKDNPEASLDLSGANLSGADLAEMNLSRANLIRGNFSQANLSGANLGGADLSETDLSKADLSRANLIGADLIGANLSEAQIGWADLSGANLIGANLTRANLNWANLSWANLVGANLAQANLRSANLVQTWVEETDFAQARLANTVFAGVELHLAKNLDSLQHEGPSHISIHTLYASQGTLPKEFLRGVGVPEAMIQDKRGPAIDLPTPEAPSTTIRLMSSREDEPSEDSSYPLTPEFLASTVAPLLQAITQIQRIIEEIEGVPEHPVIVKAITQASPVTIRLEGADKALDAVLDLVLPWRWSHTLNSGVAKQQEPHEQNSNRVRAAQAVLRHYGPEIPDSKSQGYIDRLVTHIDTLASTGVRITRYLQPLGPKGSR